MNEIKAKEILEARYRGLSIVCDISPYLLILKGISSYVLHII